MTSHIEANAMSLAAGAQGIFVGAFEKGIAAGVAMGAVESLSNMDVWLSFQDGALFTMTVGLTHAFLEGVIKAIEKFIPGVVLSEFDMYNIDAAGNLTSAILYAFFSRLLGGWSPFDGQDHLSSMIYNTMYGFTIASTTEFAVARYKCCK